MGKDPAFLFYPGDWLGGTMTFSRSHKGAYMDLLMCQFNGGHMSLLDIQIVLGSDFEKMWESVTTPELSKPLFSDKAGRDLRRKIFSEAERIELDGQGRCIMPERMLAFAGIKDNIVVNGNGDHFEIWSKNRWEEYRAEMIKQK